MARYPSLADQAVLISGGAGGIGAAMVAAFGAQDARVAFLDCDEAASEKLAAEIGAASRHRPVFATVDLRDIDETLTAVQALAELTGPFRFLLNNAGNDQAHAFDEVSVAFWDDRGAVNLRHQFFLAQAVATSMGQLGGGAIVNLGSICWRIGAANVSVYATMKAAVEGLTKSLACELGPKNIRVNAIAPGWVLTERQLAKGAADPSKFDDYLKRQSLKRHLEPQDIAEMALFLCADESRSCTGQIFTVDGGIV